MMIFDLHTHSTASDGSLAPQELLSRAAANGVTCLSVTDHDTVDAYAKLDDSSCPGVTVVPGIELSTSWAGRNIHIVGLNIDPNNSDLVNGIRQQKLARLQRAEKIAARLEKKGMDNPLEDVTKLANGSNIGRPHFARYLVEKGIVADFSQAFRKYLGNGKAGDVRQFWSPMEDIIEWILAAGGTAVLAHPAHYKLTNTRLRLLTEDFISAGGQALEIVSGIQTKQLTDKLMRLCDDLQLMASCGSDFHTPGNSWSEIGKFTRLPANCRPVWENW
ncbi:MAG: phosphatase [Gammaproteobacteria bacterium]|nr:MAG: phosphatase [Gammaproteobacteria bacterium]RLA29753.1 MAG: phosphatase [Gammaproteobacteria bacterium]